VRYLAALKDISKGGYGTAIDVVLIVAFLVLVEVPSSATSSLPTARRRPWCPARRSCTHTRGSWPRAWPRSRALTSA
jgi:hypothetical protein